MVISVDYIRSLTDFRRHSKDYVEELQASQKPMVLTVNGEAALVVQDAKAFQAIQNRLIQLEHELNRIQLETLKHGIQLGIDQVDAGEYTTYTEETAEDLVDRVKAKGCAQKGQA